MPSMPGKRPYPPKPHPRLAQHATDEALTPGEVDALREIGCGVIVSIVLFGRTSGVVSFSGSGRLVAAARARADYGVPVEFLSGLYRRRELLRKSTILIRRLTLLHRRRLSSGQLNHQTVPCSA